MPNIDFQQKMTTLGLLGSVGSAFLLSDYIKSDYVIAGSVAFGTGVAISNGFYRVAELVKNGKPEKNEFGKGTLAGLSLFCGLIGMKAIPHMVKIFTQQPFSMDTNTIFPTFVVFGIIGFLQNRNGFLQLVEDHEN